MKKIAVLILFVSLVSAQSRMAVLPFKNVSGDKQYDWLADGFAETLTSAFAQLPIFIIVERGQIERVIKEQDFQMTDYADEKKVIEIGKILGVEKMVIGSYQVFAGNISVNTRIVNVATGRIDQSGAMANKRAKLENIFDLQEEICVAQAKIFGGGTISKVDEEKISKVTSKSTNNLTSYELYNKGKSAFDAKNYDDALDYFDQAISSNPNYADAYNYKGLVYDRKGQSEDAFVNYKKAVELNPNDAIINNNLAITYAVKKEFAFAIKHSKKAIEINPNYANAYNNLGYVHDLKEEKNKALEYFTKSVELDPQNGYGFAAIGRIYADREKYSDAVEWYKKSLEVDPNDAATYYSMGTAYWSLANWEEVVDAYEKCLAINPNHANAKEWLPKAKNKLETTGGHSTKSVKDDYAQGLDYYDAEKWDLALEKFEKETVKNKRNSSAWGYLGLCYHKKEKFDDALRAYNRSILIKPTDWVYYDLGVTYWELADWDAVVDAWEECLNLNASYKSAVEWMPKAKEKRDAKTGSSISKKSLYDQGVEFYDKKNFDLALEKFKKNLETNKKDNNTLGYIGLCLYNKSQYQDALLYYNKSVRAQATDWVYYNIGLVYWQLQDWDACVDAWEECISLNPSHKQALEWLPQAKAKANK